MNLIFRKNEQEEITVHQSFDGTERKFIYVDMINALIKDGELAVPVIEGDFTVEEISSIRNMVSQINEVTREALKASAGTGQPSDDPLL